MSFGGNTKAEVGILTPEIYIPTDNPAIFHEVINDRERQTGIIMAQKENAVYALTEVLTSQSWFPTTPTDPERAGFRKAFETGTLSTGANNIPHGLTPTNFTFTHIFGGITDGTIHVPIPNGDGGTGDSVNIQVDATNIIITLTAGYNGFSGVIVLDYLKS